MMKAKSYLVSASGGQINWLSAEGEVLLSLPVPAGRVSARTYLGLCPEATEVELSPGLVVVDPPLIGGRQGYGAATFESGANPDFRPTSADRMQRELRLTLNRMQAATNRLEARERSLAKVERMPKAKPKDEAEVVEAEPPLEAKPDPKPEAKPAKSKADDKSVE